MGVTDRLYGHMGRQESSLSMGKNRDSIAILQAVFPLLTDTDQWLLKGSPIRSQELGFGYGSCVTSIVASTSGTSSKKMQKTANE